MTKEIAEAGTRDSALRWGGVRDARHTHARERPASGRDSGRALGCDSGRGHRRKREMVGPSRFSSDMFRNRKAGTWEQKIRN